MNNELTNTATKQKLTFLFQIKPESFIKALQTYFSSDGVSSQTIVYDKGLFFKSGYVGDHRLVRHSCYQNAI